MELGTFAAGIFMLQKSDDCPQGADFDLALVDVLIARAIDQAHKAEKCPQEFARYAVQMFIERALEWGLDVT